MIEFLCLIVLFSSKHAYSLSVLEPNLKPGSRALDVGSGSGFLTACLVLMVGTNGTVVGVEHVDELHQFSLRNMQNWLDSRPFYNGGVVDVEFGKQIQLVVGDGRQGWPPLAPYDAIHVGAATPTIPQHVRAHFYVCASLLVVDKT